MFAEALEPLGLENHILLARINLCAAAMVFLVFGLLASPLGWAVQVLLLVAAAGLICLSQQIGPLLKRAERNDEPAAWYVPPECYSPLH